MRVQLIYNPVAGQGDIAEQLPRVVELLESQGWDVTVRKTLGPGDATTYAREAVAHNYDMCVAMGGDGTLGEVANGLAHSSCIMGVLPTGTGNVWARMLNLPYWTPLNPDALVEATHALINGVVHSIDLGRAAGRYFILWLGVGLDAQVAHDVEPHRDIRRTLGNLTYLVTTIALSFTLRGTRLTISVDDRSVRLRTLMVVVTNAQLYGPALRLAPNARLDDGWLEVYIFKGGNILDVLRHFGSMVIGRHTRDPKVEIYRARRIEIRGESPQPLHMDGEPMGNIPVTIEVVPRALRVMVPLQAPASLFEEGTHPHQEELNLAQRIAAHVRQGGERWLEEGKQIRHDLERRLHRPTQ